MGTQAAAHERAAAGWPAPGGEPAEAGRVADRVMAGSDLDRLLYGFSLVICLPDSMSTPGSAATGTVLHPGTISDYAAQAGYTRTDILPIDHDLWRFYRLHP